MSGAALELPPWEKTPALIGNLFAFVADSILYAPPSECPITPMLEKSTYGSTLWSCGFCCDPVTACICCTLHSPHVPCVTATTTIPKLAIPRQSPSKRPPPDPCKNEATG